MSEGEKKQMDCILSEQQMGDDLMLLAACYDSIGVAHEVIPATPLIPVPTLTAILTDEAGATRIISHSWLVMPRSAAVQTKYLQYYSELQLAKLDRAVLLEGLAAINEQLPLGHCVSVRPEHGPETVGLRWIQSFPAQQPPDAGCFLESVGLFDYSFKLAQELLDALADGKTISEALSALQ